jgi:hypothetical protein
MNKHHPSRQGKQGLGETNVLGTVFGPKRGGGMANIALRLLSVSTIATMWLLTWVPCLWMNVTVGEHEVSGGYGRRLSNVGWRIEYWDWWRVHNKLKWRHGWQTTAVVYCSLHCRPPVQNICPGIQLTRDTRAAMNLRIKHVITLSTCTEFFVYQSTFLTHFPKMKTGLSNHQSVCVCPH